MPITASAKKALRQNIRRRAKNRSRKDALRAAVKKFRKLAAAKKLAEAAAELPKVYQALDKTAKAGVIKKNTASRLKSRLTSLLGKRER
jgi:small subunit ribosomal protein S20